ncbi:MAG: flagellar hook-length control protein FliK [Methylovulum sp.]|nr:flagellar hook-length control protein FliK [Methylovulum sp.]
MEIQNSPALIASTASPKSLSWLLSQLRPGYSLDAVVTAKLAENSFVLKLPGGQTLHAQAPNVLEPGQMLKLEVVKAGTTPELKIIVAERSVPPEQAVVLQALRQFLPKQQSLADFAVSLRQLATLTAGKTDAISVAVNETLSALRPKDELMSAEGLKRGISDSGIFLEAKLANMQGRMQADLKGQLLTLADVLQKVQARPETGLAATTANTLAEVLSVAADKTLLNKTEGAIARIVLDQLASLPQNDGKQNIWQIEIPFTDGQHTDAVKLKINRESKANQAGGQANWSVLLELNPPGLGTLHSRISLVGEAIDTYFWSDSAATTALVREHLTLLSARYAQAGLEVGQLNALEGLPVHVQATGLPVLPILVDERA